MSNKVKSELKVMSDQVDENQFSGDIIGLTADIVTAYVSNNEVKSEQLPGLIKTVFEAIQNLNNDTVVDEEDLKPAVPVKKSYTNDYIICLEDGKKLKMLKRYLRSRYDMTPEEYRAKWNLSADYPMVAPNYAKKRSEFAKKIGLGKKR